MMWLVDVSHHQFHLWMAGFVGVRPRDIHVKDAGPDAGCVGVTHLAEDAFDDVDVVFPAVQVHAC